MYSSKSGKHLSAQMNQKKIYPICQIDREVMMGWISVVFARKAVVDETFKLDSPIICKINVGVDASQLDPFSMCQDMSTGLVGATSSDSFLKAYKASETKSFSIRVVWQCGHARESKNTS